MANLTIDGDRLWAALMETARFGGTEKGGINRLTLTEEDRQVRDWFKDACIAAGCTVSVDEAGNMFARRPGRDNTLPPICIGSHLDTQPTGGKFDGVLGVLAGLEVLRALQASGYETLAPIEVINWTNEEGSRFAPAMLASGGFSGVFEKDYVMDQRDREGIRFGDALDAIGYRGEKPLGGHPMSAMFELHIEQGPILEAEGKTIGVVTGVQGIRWYEATITGVDSHAGTTPMSRRKDALLGAAKVVEIVNAVGLAHPPLAVATVGLMEVKPNSRNVIPGEVFLTIEMRHPDQDVLDAMHEELCAKIEAAISALGLTLQLDCILNAPPVHFDETLVSTIRAAAETLGYGHRDIVSGAGHDAAYVARVAPTTMVFVPCKDGISHNEAEDTSPADCAAGAAVLLNAVLAFDARLEAQAKG
ncbi:MAG: Zn-dependent hydrolase [Rhizobiales bacterium 24-66-13]|nr:MAG: Zn-dependent hydrolase [Rhizobiales bacterium 24-66-13]HQS07890.1 Zn-dependent hydrolase [Xanthobacteraceae bacterium]HQS44991.1 Zn-dependent hydrolase [Xanthobacteraceae bacterium]